MNVDYNELLDYINTIGTAGDYSARRAATEVKFRSLFTPAVTQAQANRIALRAAMSDAFPYHENEPLTVIIDGFAYIYRDGIIGRFAYDDSCVELSGVEGLTDIVEYARRDYITRKMDEIQEAADREPPEPPTKDVDNE